ncbi:DUF4240 domain-containing protein [Synechococcus elongatus]|uniref:DUF4240 domain-containing protein n=1 Tax=Synechococcus elongatus TaxID=32046 RepID=UPI000F7EDBDA|nr:DUF4240 domain-containing protein [Synechococcus elongatus]
MELADFWAIIQDVHDRSDGDMEAKCDRLQTQLAGLSAEEAIAFSQHFDALMDRAYDWSLWGAAYLLQGGCSDDAFSDFRASLISRGQAAYETAIANPDAIDITDFDEEAWFFEGFQYAVTDGVEAAAGFSPPRLQPHPNQPSGEEWQEEELEQLLPRLTALMEAADSD